MRRINLFFAFLIFAVALLTAHTPTYAKAPSNSPGPSKRLAFVSNEQLAKLSQALETTVQTGKLSKSNAARLLKLNAKLTACSALQDEESKGGSCFKDCLRDWGINWGSAATCLAICGISGGNPVGLLACAICLSIGENIVAGCALGCVWAPLLSKTDSAAPLKAKASEPEPVATVAKSSPDLSTSAATR